MLALLLLVNTCLSFCRSNWAAAVAVVLGGVADRITNTTQKSCIQLYNTMNSWQYSKCLLPHEHLILVANEKTILLQFLPQISSPDTHFSSKISVNVNVLTVGSNSQA